MKIKFDETDLEAWVEALLAQETVPSVPLRNLLYEVCRSLMFSQSFASFCREAFLIWPRCTPGENLDPLPNDEKEFAVEAAAPVGISEQRKKALSKALSRRGIDSLAKYPHHPERFAFQFAGGELWRWEDRQSKEVEWKVHHLYAGTHPFPGRKKIFDARKHGRHFTQTAGMTSVHPIIEEVLPHFPCVLHVLRARSFIEFRYDPDRYFCEEGHDEYGFVAGRSRPRVIDEDLDLPPEERPVPLRERVRRVCARMEAAQPAHLQAGD